MKKEIDKKSKEKMFGYIKVGRLRANIAKSAGVVAGDIYIDNPHIRHILNKHSEELKIKTINEILEYIALVISNINIILEGNKGSLLLISNTSISKKGLDTVVIELVPVNIKNNIYQVKSAYIKDKSIIYKKKVLWIK